MHKRMSYAAMAAARATEILAGDDEARPFLLEARTLLATASYRILHNSSDVASAAVIAICGGDKPRHRPEAIRTMRLCLDEMYRCT